MPEQAAPKSSSNQTTSPGNKTVIIVIIVLGVLAILSAGGYFLSQKASDEIAEKAIEQATGGDAEVSSDGSKVTVETDEGKVTIGENEVPESFPSDVTVYKESTVSSSTETEEGISLTLSTKDSVSKISDFYKKDLKDNGWKITSTSSLEGSSLITAEKGERGLLITISKDESSGNTSIGILISTN